MLWWWWWQKGTITNRREGNEGRRAAFGVKRRRIVIEDSSVNGKSWEWRSGSLSFNRAERRDISKGRGDGQRTEVVERYIRSSVRKYS